LPSEKSLNYATGPPWECAEDTPRGVVNLFQRYAGRGSFSGAIREKSRAARITMRAQAHLEQDGTCAIDNKSGDRVGVNRALGGEGLSACSGDILLESLVACAGVTLGQIANAIQADADIILPVKYWELVADQLSAGGVDVGLAQRRQTRRLAPGG